MTARPGTPERSSRPANPDFATLFEEFRIRLDGELSVWLARKRADLARLAPDAVELVEALGNLVTAGGKRLRPALVHHAHAACRGTDDDAALTVAMAVEFLHTYLLVHDDIMDHAEVRRGIPAAHVGFRELHRRHGWRGPAADYGEAVAILVGDLGHAWAVEAFSRVLPGNPRSDELRRLFFSMSEEVIAGQHLELRAAVNRTADEDHLARVLRLKSGAYSVERPIQLGAVLAGADDVHVDALSRYGTAVGEAFQLRDDVLGVFGDFGAVGKPVGSDLAEGKFTFLVFHALRLASPRDAALVEATLGDPGADAATVERVRTVIRECGALERVESMIDHRLDAARAALVDLDLEPAGGTFLEGLIGFLRERER